ncbi:MAG: dITP/XTP pyrophosphatase [Cyanobacteriota bacterium erpe_2018_sw_39hr_WHONDRS-SW48-000098_B_bin.30]|jgi:XTP/dITP diphosphohydrolase|nr:RdgB/HAM1 family non-canonical purine NTP pyrophosphatase [Candidatus Obscuribacter sp.]MBK7836453.1 RdgB/HAM1 family non-canonical purine NTP pyrophosphatase [Candidatus Obscuribacter sp.]MDQ5964905.1 dITP/XTP pyrophosphatase [Cyanobacteriota bacterium erpe_2018_sw_39hr_WHONDRS-SW48-000098_B_bin.30]
MTKQLTRSIELTLATKNPGKLKEFEAMASNLATEQPLNLLWHMAPDDFDPEETGDTFTANAVIKAARAAEMTGRLSLADDSGLTVDAMDGRPGIYSARYCAGTDRDRRLKLLDELKDVPQGKRQAAFVCALALVDKSGQTVYTTEVRWTGQIALSERGDGGFGFDPVFIPDGYQITAAEMPALKKNAISHRSMAFNNVLKYLKSNS